MNGLLEQQANGREVRRMGVSRDINGRGMGWMPGYSFCRLQQPRVDDGVGEDEVKCRRCSQDGIDMWN